MFRLVGIGERQGFGIHNIVEGWRQFDWRQPTFVEESDPKPRVVVILRMLSLFPSEAVETLSEQFSDDWPGLSEAEKLALVIAYSEKAVTHQRLSEVTNEHPRDLSAILNDLVARKFLRATGQSRGRTYHLAGQTMPEPKEVFGNLANLDEVGRVLLPEFSCPLINNLTHLHSSYRQQLEETALEPRTKKKISKEIMNQVLQNLCREQFVTATALAELVCRDPATLRGQYLTPLKNAGLLALAFPQTPTDPQQAYITTS